MSVWSRENECTLCHEKCEGEARQREHEKSPKHGKKVMVDIYFKEFGDGSRFVDEASNLVKRYRISGDRHLGLDWIHELHLPFSNDTLWACSICNESGANYEEADGHLFSLEHIRNHVSENDIENDVLPSDDNYTAYEKLLALRNEIIQKQSENGEEMAKPEVVKLSLQKSDIFKRLGLTEEASALFEIKKIPDMPKFAILQCDVCYQLLPVSAGKKVVIAQIYSAHECTDDHRRYNLMKGVLNQFEPRDIEDEELTNSKKPYTWREANGVYYGPMCGTIYLVVTDTEQFCTLCCCVVEKVEEHFTSEKHIAAYLALEQPIGVYRLLQLSERTRREQLLRLCNTSNLRNGKCMQIKCPRLPTLLKFLALPEAHRLPTIMPELIDQGDGDYGLKCMQCTTMLKVPAQELEGGARIWNSHIESEMHIAAAVTCSRRRFLDRFYVPAISTFKLDKTELHGKWEKQSIGQGANCMEIYTQTQCDVGLECIVDDLEREEISCMLCTRTFKKTTPEAATVINRHLRSFMHVYRYFYFTNPQLCSIFTEQESDAASQEFLLDCLRREPPRPNHLIRLYSPDLCLELDDLPRVPFDMIKSEPIAEAENEIENGEKKEGTEDGNVQVETVMVSLRDAFQGLNIRLIDVSRDSKKKINKILCRCLECNLAFVLHKDRLKEDLYDNHINAAEHRRRKEEYQANQFAPKDFMEEFSGHTVKPYPQQKEEKAVWLPNGQYVLSVVGLEYIVEKRIEVPQENPPEMPPEGEEREPEPAEKIVNFYCKCCCVNFPLKSFHLENHVRSYEHIINYLNVNSPQTLWELDMIRGIFRGVDGKKAEEEVKKAIVTFVKDLKPPATYCIAVYDPAGVMHLKKEDAWKKAQARQREAHQELERRKATEERIKKDKERQELKAQIYEEKVKKMTEAAEQKKKIDERLKAIKEQQEMELEKRRQEKAKRDEQERKLDALNRIIEEDAAKKSKLVRSQDPEAEAKRNMAHYRMQDVKKQLEAKKGILLKDSKEATIDEPKLVIPAKLTESMQLKNAQQSRLQAELDMQQKNLAASSAMVPNLSQPPPSLPPTSLPPLTVMQLPITSMPPPSIAPAAPMPQMNQINQPPPFQTPIWGMSQQQQPVGINFGVPPPTQPQLVQPQLAQPVVQQQIQAGMQQFVQPTLVQPTLAQPVVPQVQPQHQNLPAPGILAPHQLLRMGNPGSFGLAPTPIPLQQPAVPASGFNVPPPGWGLTQPVVSSASLSFQPVPPPVSAATLSSLPSTSQAHNQAQPPQQRQELHFDPKPHFSNYVPRIERIPQYPTKDGDEVPMSESDDDSVKSASPSPSRNKEEPEEKVIGRPDIAPEVMWPVKRVSLSMRKPDPTIMMLKNRTELEKMLLKNGFEKTPTGELPMQFNKKALKTKGAVGIENLYEIVCVDLPELDTMYCVECRVWDTFQNMIEHLASEDHQLTFLLKNHRYLHDQVTREDNAAMKRVTLQQFCQTIQQQTRQDTVSQRFRTLIDKAVIIKYCPEFIDNIAYEWLGYATPRVDRSALFGKSPSRHSRKRSSSRSPSRTSKRRRRSRSRSPYNSRSRRSRSRTRSRSRERRSRSRSPRRSYRRRSRSSSRSRDRSSRKERDRDADRKKASAPAPTVPSIMTAPQGTAADVKFPPTGLGALGDGRWDSSSNKFIPASSAPAKTIAAGLQDPRLSMRTTASPQKPASDPLASFAANIANLRNFATKPAAGTGQMEQVSQISQQPRQLQQPIQQVQPTQQQQPMQQVQQMAGRNMQSQQSGRTDRVERDRDERGRDREDRGRSRDERSRDRDREPRDKDDRYRQTTGSMQQQQSASQIQPQRAPQIRQEASAPITQATQQSHSQSQQQQYPGSSSLSESIAQVQKKMAEEKSVRLRKLLGLTVAIDQEKTKGYVISPERLIQMFREFGVAPTTIGVATVDDLMRFLNDELRSLQGLQPAHTAAQQQIPQINLQQFGISVAPTQTAPSFPAPYNSQGVYRQVQQQQMPPSSANVSNMSNVSTYQQLPSTSNSSQLYTASIGGSTANTYIGSTQHTQQQQQFHQQTHQQPQMQTYQQQSSYSQYQQQQQQLTQSVQSMQSMPQQGGGYQASMSTSYVHPQQIQQTRQTHQQGHSQVHLPSALVVPEKPKSPILKPNPYVFTHTEDIYSGPAYRPIVYPGKNADGEQDDDWDDLEAFMTGRK